MSAIDDDDDDDDDEQASEIDREGRRKETKKPIRGVGGFRLCHRKC